MIKEYSRRALYYLLDNIISDDVIKWAHTGSKRAVRIKRNIVILTIMFMIFGSPIILLLTLIKYYA